MFDDHQLKALLNIEAKPDLSQTNKIVDGHSKLL